MNERKNSVTRQPINRDRIRERALLFGPQPDATPAGIEEYIVAFSGVEWARAIQVAPGSVRLEVWSSQELDFDRLLHLINDAGTIAVGYSVAPPAPLKRAQLFVTFAIGRGLMRAHEWLFDQLGGTWT